MHSMSNYQERRSMELVSDDNLGLVSKINMKICYFNIITIF